MQKTVRVLLTGVCLLSGCADDPEMARLDRTYEFAKAQVEAIGKKEIAALAYADIIDTGGSPLTYVLAAAPDGADMVRIVWQGKPIAWSVRIDLGPGDQQLRVDAYAESIATPVHSVVLDATPMRVE
jgi:hypothetical protein